MTQTPSRSRMAAMTIDTGNGDTHDFTGELVGEGSSHRTSHLHPASAPPPPGKRCSGCRWTETRIYFSESDGDDGSYIVQTIGRSILEGEEDKIKTTWADEAANVIEALLLPPLRHVVEAGGPNAMELPKPSEQAILAAARIDGDIYDAVLAWKATSSSGNSGSDSGTRGRRY